MKIKTSELSGAALDWAVAKCEGDELAALNIQFPEQAKHYRRVSPSSDWAQGGPIIEREGIGLNRGAGSRWMANIHTAGVDHLVRYGPTPLIAAMRCFVASRMGDEVDVPEELT